MDVISRDALSDAEADEIAAAATSATSVDGHPALNEAGLLHLRHPRPAVSHLIVRSAGLAGYGQLDRTATPTVAQLFVVPERRRHGIGRALLDELLRIAPGLRIWAAGDSPAAQALAARTGLRAARQLLIMERPLADPLPEPAPTPGITLRAFLPGQDETAWLAVNAAAFAHHPEQGGMTRGDLDERLAEDWFDPAGFLVAERDGELIGFHWTKQHPDRVGEVYVLGIGPAAAGRGLGRALLLAGLRHLRAAGNDRVRLYVEGDNTPALTLYRGYGFVEVSRDVMYARG